MKRFLLLTLLTFAFAGLAWSQSDGTYLRGTRSVNENAYQAQTGEDESVKLFIPNAFTPNGDGINDTYHIPNSNFNKFSFQVFDRWGNKMYETQKTSFHWDGTANGKTVPAGIYVFMLEGTTQDNLKIKRSGTISIVR